MDKVCYDILLPIIETSTVMAAHYAKSSGRDTVTPEDIEYSLKYNAMHRVGLVIGSLYPEIYEDSDSEEDDEFIVDNDTVFTRYLGDDEWCIKMNEAYDSWDSWIPGCPMEEIIKKAIDSQQSS